MVDQDFYVFWNQMLPQVSRCFDSRQLEVIEAVAKASWFSGRTVAFEYSRKVATTPNPLKPFIRNRFPNVIMELCGV